MIIKPELPQDLSVTSSPTFNSILAQTTTANLFNATATTLNIGGEATTIAIGASGVGSKTTINSAQILAGDGTALLPVYSFAADPNTGLYRVAEGVIDLVSNGSIVLRMSASEISVTLDIPFTLLGDVVLRRDAANTLALRNGANAQQANIYGTYTDASNYERLAIISGATLGFYGQIAGTGIVRNIEFGHTGGYFKFIRTGQADLWTINISNGNLFTGTDNVSDIGAAGATRPRTAYLGTSLVSPTIYGDTAANGDITIEGTSSATKTTSTVSIQPNGGLVSIGGEITATVAPIVHLTNNNAAKVNMLSLKVTGTVSGWTDTLDISIGSTSSRGVVLSVGETGSGAFGDPAEQISLLLNELKLAQFNAYPITFYTDTVERARIDGTGNVIIGVTAAGATAAKTLALTNSAVDPTSSADLAHLYAHDISASNACLALYQETATITTVDNAANRKVPMWVNGVQLYVLATTSNA